MNMEALHIIASHFRRHSKRTAGNLQLSRRNRYALSGPSLHDKHSQPMADSDHAGKPTLLPACTRRCWDGRGHRMCLAVLVGLAATRLSEQELVLVEVEEELAPAEGERALAEELVPPARHPSSTNGQRHCCRIGSASLEPSPSSNFQRECRKSQNCSGGCLACRDNCHKRACILPLPKKGFQQRHSHVVLRDGQ